MKKGMVVYAFPASEKTTVSKKYDNFIDLESYLFLLIVFLFSPPFSQKKYYHFKSS